MSRSVSLDLSNDEELQEAFNWKNTHPLLEIDNLQKEKGRQNILLKFSLQFVKAYRFLKKKKKDDVKIFIDEIFSKTPKKKYQS